MIKIWEEKCKGCGLCVVACSYDNLEISKKSNSKGYFPPIDLGVKCTDCGRCFTICPDVAIKIGEEK